MICISAEFVIVTSVWSWRLQEHYCLLQEIYKDRKKFAKAVFEVSSSDLVNMGISIVSYTIKDISDQEVCLFASHVKSSL